MKNKICLVTGGTSGIGQTAAAALARQGATVLLTGRDRSRGDAAVAAIRDAGGQAEFLPADLSTMANVRALADAVRGRCDRLDVLVNNAGLIGRRERTLTADGFEEVFAVNHLAPFLLTHRLGDLLRAAAPARVVTVSSDAHKSLRTLDFDNLQGERRYKPFLAYSQSKLENVLFTYELARRMAAAGVTANCLHPGVVRTRIWQAAGTGLLGALVAVGKLFMISAERGGASVARLAADPALAGVTGRYFHRDREGVSTPVTHDPQVAARLWEISARLIGTV